jgi:hypothetical protein
MGEPMKGPKSRHIDCSVQVSYYRPASVIFRLRNNMSLAPRHVSLRPLQLLAAEEDWGLEAEPEDRVELARYVLVEFSRNELFQQLADRQKCRLFVNSINLKENGNFWAVL